MENKKTTILREETANGLLKGLEDYLINDGNESDIGDETESSHIVISIEDLLLLQKHLQKENEQLFIATFLNQLEDFSAEQLEHIISLATSQLNIKMARDYFEGRELA